MATNNDKSDGYLNGAIRERTQFEHPNGHWVKRDTNSGRFVDMKSDGQRFKSVRREK